MSVLDRVAQYWLKWLERLTEWMTAAWKQLLNYKPKDREA